MQKVSPKKQTCRLDARVSCRPCPLRLLFCGLLFGVSFWICAFFLYQWCLSIVASVIVLFQQMICCRFGCSFHVHTQKTLFDRALYACSLLLLFCPLKHFVVFCRSSLSFVCLNRRNNVFLPIFGVLTLV